MKKYNIKVIVKAWNSDFWQTMLSGAKAAMAEAPDQIEVEVMAPPEESDILQQVEMLKQVVNEKPDGIVIASTSNDLTVPFIEAAMDAGIPVVTLDNQVSTEKYTSFIGTDSKIAAGMAADALFEKLHNSGEPLVGKKVIVINSSKISKVDLDRDAGFIERIKTLAPEIEILETQYVENDVVLTENTVCELLHDRNLVGIFADNDMTGVGIANGIRRAGAQGRVFSYAFDANEVEIEAVQDEVLTGMIVQKPFQIGYMGVQCVIDALAGNSVERKIDPGAELVTKENLQDRDVQKLLYPEKM